MTNKQFCKFLGRVLNFDPVKETITFKIDFFDTAIQGVLEDLLQSQQMTSIQVDKPFRPSKTYPQLKKYHALLKNIILKCESYPTKEHMDALDDSIKERVFPCSHLSIMGDDIPVKFSKAESSMDEMSELIQYVLEKYEPLLRNVNV